MTKKIYYRNGLDRLDYNQDKARLVGFEAIESDWIELFRWIMSVSSGINFYNKQGEKDGCISDLWSNHILTVFVEIVQIDVEQYKTSFIQGRGTTSQQQYSENLEEKIREWIVRIEKYLLSGWQMRQDVDKNPAILAAKMIKNKLEESLLSSHQGKHINRTMKTENHLYYRMLSTIDDISIHRGYYIEMIEKGNDMDAGLSLLLTFVRNYSSIAKRFNQKFTALPLFYKENILHATARKATPDHTYVVVTPVASSSGFSIPKGTGFKAGITEDKQELIYKTMSWEYITKMKIEKVNAVFLRKDNGKATALYKQPIDYADPATYANLFSDDEKFKSSDCGWLIESPMLVLNEGRRKVKIYFVLTPLSASRLQNFSFSEEHLNGAFSVWISTDVGWTYTNHHVSYENLNGENRLVFEFTLCESDKLPFTCSNKAHSTTTMYPAVRILADNNNCPYDWATQITFQSICIDIDVEGIRNFNLYNELGEIDSAQPFHAFGAQGQQGAWFMFGNEEIARKNITEVSLIGTWSKLPQTENGYNDLYKDYSSMPPVTNESFRIKTEWRKNGKWISDKDTCQALFTTINGKLDENALIKFDLSQYEQSQCDCFRVMLQEPAIGFGMEKYRELFANTMIYNSRQKEKKQRNIPISPIIPMLSDMKLSYKASQQIDMNNYTDDSCIRLSRITMFPENKTIAITDNTPQAFLPVIDAEHAVYIAFGNALGRNRIKMFFDMVFTKQNIFSEDISITSYPQLEWDYTSEEKWIPLPSEAVRTENTCGFTQSGYIEIEMPESINRQHVDANSLFWLRIRFIGDTRACLAARCIYMNCLNVTAENGDGASLPAMTIQKLQKENEQVDSIIQPFPGFGGKLAETPEQSFIRQSYRIFNRNRAVTPVDYEQIILEQFQEIEKVYCIPQTHNTITQGVNIVVFSPSDDNNQYPLTPSWKLVEIRKYLSAYISPFAQIQVINPTYQKVDIECIITLKPRVSDKGRVIRRMTSRIRHYYAQWLRKGTLPELGQQYSYKELYTRLVNDMDIQELQKLTVNGKWLEDVDIDIKDWYLSGNTPWSIIVPGKISIITDDNENTASGKIGLNFIIG